MPPVYVPLRPSWTASPLHLIIPICFDVCRLVNGTRLRLALRLPALQCNITVLPPIITLLITFHWSVEFSRDSETPR
ncbi:hypothetical protein FA13DRAFT_1140852 [Coprinellus micaceus]|uniref:Uncharacterized protein n=1 Tax=Coprinellus micaceus TaxID=71717 RepID=A0A4Y7SV19_COPMI|nr:hypothetical protein FA13DRAFT_1140852 [Coprinellus micaceus]